MMPAAVRPVRFIAAAGVGAATGLGLLLSAAGCGVTDTPPKPTVPDFLTPGTDFDTAPLLVLDADGIVRFSNSLSHDGVHVFDLGPLAPGDRLIVDVASAAGSPRTALDPTVAVFDADADLFTLNDDVDLDAGRLESHIDEVIRYASEHYFVAIAPSFFGTTSGAYDATVRVLRSVGLVAPANQVVFLNFDGGTITIPAVGRFDVPPFDAARIDEAYAGQTDLILRTVINTVSENFRGLNITLLNSVDDDRPSGAFSEIFFGGFNRNAFGISEAIDHWNKIKSDQSIVFTDRFDDPFSPQPSAAGIAAAIGNVAAHEIGHLLGLEHTADVTDLMDTTGRASTLLADQDFKRADLDDTVFPIGAQDAWEILSAVLGLVSL